MYGEFFSFEKKVYYFFGLDWKSVKPFLLINELNGLKPPALMVAPAETFIAVLPFV